MLLTSAIERLSITVAYLTPAMQHTILLTDLLRRVLKFWSTVAHNINFSKQVKLREYIYRILSNKRLGALEKCLEMGALWSYV